MKYSISTILITGALLAGCSNNQNQAMYQGFQTQNEFNKPPIEREQTPFEHSLTPKLGYTEYKKERDNLIQPGAAADKKESPDFNLK